MLFTYVFWYYVTIKNLTCYRMVQFAQIRFHKNWIDNQWQQILWRDESIFEIFGSKPCQYVGKRWGER